MNNYQRLALLLLVLLLSVGLLSSAISILGDINELNLEDDVPGTGEPEFGVAGLTKAGGEEVPVDDPSMAKMGPIFEIIYPPKTVYLRRMICEEYRNGSWVTVEDGRTVDYNGETLEGIDYQGQMVEFIIDPVLNMKNYAPVTSNVRSITYNGTLDYYPELDIFGVREPSSDPYVVYYTKYDFPTLILHQKKALEAPSSLQLPEQFSRGIKDLAEEVTSDQVTDYGRYNALEEYLRENYAYDEDFNSAPNGMDPVEWFLFNEERGICSHFNSAFVLMARSIGLPARVVMGFQVKPDVENQFVMPQQAHLYAEAPLGDLGWVTFDATPFRIEEDTREMERLPTVTNITGNDPEAVKGKPFHVWGTVKLTNGTNVTGPQVEVYMKVNKTDPEENGTVCGVGVVEDGFFNITCQAEPSLEVGDYSLVAHTMETAKYAGSWSDPPIKLITETKIKRLNVPRTAYLGSEVKLEVQLLDAASNEPVEAANLTFSWSEEEGYTLTDDEGKASFSHIFEDEGVRNVTVAYNKSEYYLGTNSTFGVSVTIPPEVSLFALITSFPYNILLITGIISVIGIGLVMSRREEEVEILVPSERYKDKPLIDDDKPLTFDTYEEGIVKIFNRFYNTSQRVYPEIADSLTPREFERVILNKIPPVSDFALDDLVTCFEIAEYGNMKLGEEDFNRCKATVELLVELMRDEEGDEEKGN